MTLRNLFTIVSACAMTALTSCTADEPVSGNGNGDTVRLTVSLPENLATRAFGDAASGEGAPNSNHLVVSIFDTENNFINSVDVPSAFASSLTQTVELQLAKNMEYNLVFWAYNDQVTDAPYTYDPKTGQLQVTYANVKANDEAYDAFYSMEKIVKSTGTTHDVKLKRPFAQVNIGSADLDNPAVQSIIDTVSSTLTVTSGLYDSVNLLTSELGEEVTAPVEIAVDPIPAPMSEGSMFPVEGYQNIQMNYLLVGKPGTDSEKSLVDASLRLAGGSTEINTLNLSAMPVRSNFRTNVFGNLLTTIDTFTVTITPAFDGNYPIDRSGEVGSVDDLNELISKGEKDQFIVTGPVTGGDNEITLPATGDTKNYSFRFENISDDAVVTINSSQIGRNTSISVSTPGKSSPSFVIATPATTTLNGGYGEVTTSANKTTVAENANVGQMYIRNGSLAVRGNVADLSRTEDNATATKTAVIVYEGGELENAPEGRIHVVTFPLFSGGTGTPDKPYKMTKAKDFQDILYLGIADEYDTWYRTPMILENDIDMTTEDQMRNLGTSSMMLDGNGHTLNVNFSSESSEGMGSNVGLFAGFNGAGNSYIREATDAEKNSPYAYTLPFNGKTYIITGGCIRNLNLTGSVYADKGTVSPLGCGQNTGYILDVTSHVNVTAAGDAYFVAGIIGGTRGTGLVIGCKNYGTIDASASKGGIVAGITAQLYGGSSCNGTYPDILAPYSASVYGCYNYGNIIAGGKDVGGIVGQTHGYGGLRCIMNCGNTGNITGTTNVGGIIGRHTKTGGTMMIQNCTNSGTITATAADGLWGALCGAPDGTFADGSQKKRR